MSQLWSDPWIEAILFAALRGVPLLLLAGAAAIGWRRSSAAARHLMWLVAIACMLALPLLSASLPAWRVAVLPPEQVEAPAKEEPVVTLPAAARRRSLLRRSRSRRHDPPLTSKRRWARSRSNNRLSRAIGARSRSSSGASVCRSSRFRCFLGTCVSGVCPRRPNPRPVAPGAPWRRCCQRSSDSPERFASW
jgi:hypothetical protein